MNHRSRDIETLFQRLAAANAIRPDRAIAEEAAHAAAEWPLLAMLTGARPTARPVHHMMMAVADTDDRAASADTATTPMPAAPATSAAPDHPSTLEQLFLRVERSGKQQGFQSSVFETAADAAKVRSLADARQDRPAPPRVQSAAVPADAAIAIEPSPRLGGDLETAPERLFARVGGR